MFIKFLPYSDNVYYPDNAYYVSFSNLNRYSNNIHYFKIGGFIKCKAYTEFVIDIVGYEETQHTTPALLDIKNLEERLCWVNS